MAKVSASLYLANPNRVSTTGNITANSKVITNIPSTAALQVGNVITGTGQAPYAEILTIDSSTSYAKHACHDLNGIGLHDLCQTGLRLA
jgi:hypothetical protein